MTKEKKEFIFSYESYKEEQDLVRCVQLYYGEKKGQSDIGSILGIPQSRVSRLLQKADEEKYFEIQFNFPTVFDTAQKLSEKYGLKESVVIISGESKYLKEDLGRVAARYFESKIKDGDKIGISCGHTLYYMVQSIRNTEKKDLQIYPLAADNSYKAIDVIPNTLVGMLTGKLRPNAISFSLPAQVLTFAPSSVLEKCYEELLSDEKIKEIYENAGLADVIFSGIGEISAETPGFGAIANEKGLSPTELKQQLKAVAEYNYIPIDKDGKPLIENKKIQENTLFQEVSKRILSISLDRFKRNVLDNKLVVCVAGGKSKYKGIKAVLNGKLANVLITDFDTATFLLSQ